MKICIVSSYHLEVTGPLVKRLQEDNEVDFYVPVNNNEKNIFLFGFDATTFQKTGFLNEEETATAVGTHKEYFSKVKNIFFFLYPDTGYGSPSLYKLFLELSFRIRRNKYDVIHVIGQFPLLLTIHLVNYRTPRVHTLHESVPHAGPFPAPDRAFMKLMARLKAQLIFPSDTTRKRFLEFTGCKPGICHTVYFGIVENYSTYIDPAIREKKNQVLLFGFINSYKGVEYLAGAIDIVRKKIPDVQSVIAGRWSLPDLKKELSEKPNFVIIDQTLSNQLMTSLIQESAAVVCPYTSASNSGVIMTAFVFDKPVIATSIDGLAEVISDGENGLLVKPRDTDSLAAAILRILENETERNQMKKNIEELKRDSPFAWDTIHKQTEKIYKLAITND